MAGVADARYGKDNVRLYKVHRDLNTGIHTVTETTICCLLEGDIQKSCVFHLYFNLFLTSNSHANQPRTSYTHADNSVIVATDSIKIQYIVPPTDPLCLASKKADTHEKVKAKQNPISPPEQFGAILSEHFVNTYPHIHSAHVKVITHRWTRITVDGAPHPHSFVRDGAETRNVSVVYRRNIGFTIISGMQGLLVLKSTGSAFHGFIRDEYTTLPDVWDRILSTEIDASWEWESMRTLDEVRNIVPLFDPTFDSARKISLATFAKDESASVQATMFKIAEQILSQEPLLTNITYSLPNKHYFEIDLSWHKGIKNTGKDAEVYVPQCGPNGLIKCTVSRSNPAAKL